MGPSGRFSEIVSMGVLEGNPGSATQAAQGEAVWKRLEEKLGALAARECARQHRRFSSLPPSKEVLDEIGQSFASRVVETFQQAAEELPHTDEQVAARAAISYLFALDAALASDGTAGRQR